MTPRSIPAAETGKAAADRNRRFLLAVACGRWPEARRIADGPISSADARVTRAWGYRRALCREVLALTDADPDPDIFGDA